MAIKEIAPHISCVCHEDDFEEAKAKYSEIYVLSLEGIFKYVKFRYDRYLCVKVDKVPDIPKKEGEEPTQLKQELVFLPKGERIPYELFKQIVAFFKKVIEVKKSEVEAHVHILWNPTLGYYLAVPNQKVSKASVSYDYSHIGKDDVIIADFHSHNTMGAFYSGTDEADDKNKTYYTGVLGKLNQPTPEFVLRFNYNEMKRPCGLEEIFDIDQEEVEVPKEWLDRIQTQAEAYRQKGGYPGTYQGSGYAKGNNGSSIYNRYQQQLDGMPFGYGGDSLESAIADFHARNQGGPETPKATESAVKKEGSSVSKSKERITEAEDEDLLSAKIDPESGDVIFHNEPEVKVASKLVSPGYMDYVTMQYGEDVAGAFDQALSALDDLDNVDEVLTDIIKGAIEKLTPHGRKSLMSS